MKLGKRGSVVALFLILFSLLSSSLYYDAGNNIKAAELGNVEYSVSQLNTQSGKRLFDQDLGISKPVSEEQYESNDDVTIIVELKDKSLLDGFYNTAGDSQGAGDVEKYINCSEEQDKKQEILFRQNQLIHKIKSDGVTKLKIVCHYTTVMNGFAAVVKYKDIENIEKNDKVKQVEISPQYQIPVDEMEVQEQNNVKAEELKQEITNLTGKGTEIAIIDTGADLNHEVFQKEVSNPKASYSDIQDVIQSNTLHAEVNSADQVYKNTKVPFSYDYADDDTDVCPDKQSIYVGNAHGTHVAAAAGAGESGCMSGTAKDTQLLIMKVFNDKEGTSKDDDILQALEDSVVLGADVINMSLGAVAGFSNPDSEILNQVYQKILKAGIAVVVSAGNNYDSGHYNGLANYSLSDNPDIGTINAPASYSNCIAVASVAGGTVVSPYFIVGEKKIKYTEWAFYGQKKFSELAGDSYEYCIIPGNGENADYESIDVSGKIAVAARSYVSYTDQVKAAENAGAVALIIYNVLDDALEISLNQKVGIPVISIDKEAGEYLISQEDKKLKSIAAPGVFNEGSEYSISQFSSWGATPGLKLKPEIAVPGENIYSALPFNNYGAMTGTSMAAPILSGYYALMKEHIEQSLEFKNLTEEEKLKLIMQLLMSTSTPVKNANGVFCSPRKQGSGVGNIEHAATTEVYLYTDPEVEENSKPELNLYDDPERTGKFTSKFHIKNFGTEAATYKIDYKAMKEAIVDYTDSIKFLALFDKSITDRVQVDFRLQGVKLEGNTITVGAGEDVEIQVDFQLSSDLMKEYDTYMKNGGYFEGYIQLSPQMSGQCQLTIPYLGFYGDWTSASLIDTGDIYENGPYTQSYNALYTNNGNAFLGINPFDQYMYNFISNGYNPYFYSYYYENYALKPDRNKIAISPNNDGKFDSLDWIQISLLRNAKTFKYEIKDSKGKVLQSINEENVTKSMVNLKYGKVIPEMMNLRFPSIISDETKLENNEQFTVVVHGTLDYDRHEMNNIRGQVAYPVTIDLEQPKVVKAERKDENNQNMLVCTVSDNQYVSYVGLAQKQEDGSLKKLDARMVNEEKKGKSTDITFDITDKLSQGMQEDGFVVVVYDYALNEAEYSVKDLNNTETVSSPSPSSEPSAVPSPSSEPSAVPSLKPSSGSDFNTEKPEVTENPSMDIGISKVTGLRAISQTEKSIKIKWNRVKNATGYEIYIYNKAEKKYIKQKTLCVKNTTYTLTKVKHRTLQPGNEYKIKIRAYSKNDAGCIYGKFSDELKAYTCMNPVKASIKHKKLKVLLTWTREKKASGYEIYFSDKKSTGYKKLKTITTNNQTNFMCSNLANGKVWYYKIRTYKIIGGKRIYSSFSNIVKTRINI